MSADECHPCVVGQPGPYAARGEATDVSWVVCLLASYAAQAMIASDRAARILRPRRPQRQTGKKSESNDKARKGKQLQRGVSHPRSASQPRSTLPRPLSREDPGTAAQSLGSGIVSVEIPARPREGPGLGKWSGAGLQRACSQHAHPTPDASDAPASRAGRGRDRRMSAIPAS